MNASAKETLLNEFEPSSYEDWKAAAEKLLKGAPFEKKLLTKTPEGITLQPIYNASDLEGITAAETFPGANGNLRGTRASGYRTGAWEIAQEFPIGDPGDYNKALLEALHRGQDAINVTFDIATVSGMDPDSAKVGDVGACGLSISCLKDFQTAFSEVLPDAVSFHFQTGAAGLPLASLFNAWLDSLEVDVHKIIKGSFNCDPLAVLAASGTLPTSLPQAYDELAATVRLCLKELPGFRAVGVSSLPYHQAGCNAVEELACVLATGVTYIRALTERGLTVDEAAIQIRFTLSIGGNFFMELAKLRAFRTLWSRIVKELGGGDESAKALIHGRTGLYNKTQLDPYVNLLRTTTEALCGVTGGVDSLCVGAFDECIRTSGSQAMRFARNTQVMLQEECELTAVADPAGGSWFIEKLTDELGRKAWSTFQEIEKDGGIFESLENAKLQSSLAEMHTEKTKSLAQRRTTLVGTNNYPNIGEKPLESSTVDFAELKKKRSRELSNFRLSASVETDHAVMVALGDIAEADHQDWAAYLCEAYESGATIGEVTRSLRNKVDVIPYVKPLPSYRLSQQYEALRAASSAWLVETGNRPKLFLVTMGALRRHKPRADFTRGFFETGGFEVIYPNGFESADDAVKALKESGAKAAILCGHDDDYAEKAADFFKALKASQSDLTVMLAGDPGDKGEAFEAAGMDGFISIKTNNYQTNADLLQKLGVL